MLFDRSARRRARDRAASSPESDRWLTNRLAERLLEHIEAVTVEPRRALLIGCADGGQLAQRLMDRGATMVSCDPGFAFARQNAGVQCDEDRLPFADGSFDMILCCGTLDTVNDLPGALILFNRALAPNGFLGASMIGAPSLATVKEAMIAAELELVGSISAHVHPQLDLRSIGDLLLRAGFRMPVVDADTLSARYSSLSRLTADLRAGGLRNQLNGRRPLPRAIWHHVHEQLRERFEETFSIISLAAWKAAEGEPNRIGPSGLLNQLKPLPS
jgi:NADH dehydrogenase [ubiquinone] 1 alpha subcomplex assembly factor 5